MEDIVRPELNFEKWPGIWQPARSNNKLNKIVLQRKINDSNVSKIEILANSEYGPLTTETQKIIYALYKISEENGHPRRIPFSCSKIARILNKKWGRGTANTIKKGLYQLRFTAFVLKNMFYDSTSKKHIRSFTDTFTILTALKISDEETDGHVTKEICYCEFNEYIYNNLLDNHVKPTRLDVVLSFGDDGIAQSFYGHFDLLLANTNKCRRTIDNVFYDINLTGKEYQKLSVKKRTFDRIKPSLDGKELSSNGKLEVYLEKTSSGYDLVGIKKIDKEKHSVKKVNKTKNTAKEVSLAVKKRIEKLSGAMPADLALTNADEIRLETNTSDSESAKELVVLFAKKFFNLENVKATTKELSQAKQLIEEFGFDTSKYIVEYAYQQAAVTNYKIGQFGAIMEYAGRGAAQYERNTKIKEHRQKLENCQFCSGLIYIDVVNDKTEKARYKLKCPHSLEQLKIISKEKQIKIKIVNGQIIENF